MPSVAVRGEPLDTCGIDDDEAGAKLGHTAKVGDIESQDVRNCVSVANSNKPSVMNLLPDNPEASHHALPSRIDIRCILDQRKGGLQDPLPGASSVSTAESPKPFWAIGRVAMLRNSIKTCEVKCRIFAPPSTPSESWRAEPRRFAHSLMFANRPNTFVSTR